MERTAATTADKHKATFRAALPVYANENVFAPKQAFTKHKEFEMIEISAGLKRFKRQELNIQFIHIYETIRVVSDEKSPPKECFSQNSSNGMNLR